jgi:hypothetical protein
MPRWLSVRNFLVDRAHNGFEPPFGAASGSVAAIVESAGNRAQAMAAQSQAANCDESRLLGRVRLDMDAISGQSIAKPDVSDPFPFATFVP